jgi:hypothetical protein
MGTELSSRAMNLLGLIGDAPCNELAANAY